MSTANPPSSASEKTSDTPVSFAAKEKTAIAYAGFVARPDDRMAATEEDRTSARDNVELHPSWQAERIAGRWEVEGGQG